MIDRFADCVFIGFKAEQLKNLPLLSKKAPLEYWNLQKMSYYQFIRRLKAKVPPANENVSKHNYSVEKEDKQFGIGITKEEYEKLSWGILFPNYYDYNFYHFTFCLYEFKDFFLTPDILVTNIGIQWFPRDKNDAYMQLWFEDELLEIINSGFHNFYEKYHQTFSRIIIDYSQISKWSQEDWRIYMSFNLYRDFHTYKTERHLLTWQKEFVDSMTIFEMLLTAEENEQTEIGYRLKKRFGLLLGKQFPDYATVLSKAYKFRSEFVHGSIFVGLKKRTKVGDDEASGIANLTFSKEVLYISTEIQRYLRYLVFMYAVLYEEMIKTSSDFKDVISALEAGLRDDFTKKKIQKIVSKTIRWLPE
ncbi:MAG: hypothetical protein UR96_C0047G0022 [candidate division WS6 bacterium GW2011_GWC1_36_11]|uniref:Uncharacterized protein n=1 Tax=candidate division WS6 bacterium GW2011_GWC1_36_11 TaxID=1619090 RepID=A0A0G0GEK0_9BACT|nr:MAG: hypothetical protein UR96_C0047G0022 [candidate division WS6 bacterium GW2011_GWC1_36_11]